MAAADTLFRERRTNSLVAWVLVAVIAVTAVEEFATGDLLWAGFAAVVALVVVVPAVRYVDPGVMPPWEVILLAALPVIGRAVATLELTSALGTYLAVAAVALIIAVELHAFTPVRMTVGFAIVFVVVATMATSGIWALARGASDWWLGTTFLPHTPETEVQLGWEFVYSTAAGVIAGGIFEFYFRRKAPVKQRVPDNIVEEIDEELEDLVHYEEPGEGER